MLSSLKLKQNWHETDFRTKKGKKLKEKLAKGVLLYFKI